MTTYHVTLYNRTSSHYIIETDTPEDALEKAEHIHETASLNEAEHISDDGYCVHNTETGEYWWDDENSLEEEEA